MSDDGLINIEDGRITQHLREILTLMGYRTSDQEHEDDVVIGVSRTADGTIAVDAAGRSSEIDPSMWSLVTSIAQGVNLVGLYRIRMRHEDDSVTFISLTARP